MCPRPRPCPWRISREPGALLGAARLGYPGRPRSGERAPDDDRAAARGRADRRRDVGRRRARPLPGRPFGGLSIRSPARGCRTLSGIRAGDRRRRERGPRRRRHARPRARRPGGNDQRDGRRREPARGATAQRPGRAARHGRPGSGRRPCAVAAAHRGDSPRCGARSGRDRPRARAGAACPHLSGGHDQRARRAAARRRRGGLRPRRGDRGHAAPRGSGTGPAVVRRGRGERRRRGVAAMSTAPHPRRPAFGRSLLRLFTVQGSWNYERMQGVGMGVAEEPLLRDLRVAGNGAVYRAAVARGAHFFNAHPYLCGLAVGAAARAEHEGVPPEQVERLRTALCGPLGSLGDRLVWAGWLPFTSGLALIGVALGLGLPAVLGFLGLFNAGHVALRWWALRAGWTHGLRVAQALREPLLQRATALSGPAMALVIGAALPLVAQYLSSAFFGWARVALAGVVAGGVPLLWLQRARLTRLRLGPALLALAAPAGGVMPGSRARPGCAAPSDCRL